MSRHETIISKFASSAEGSAGTESLLCVD